MSKYLIPAAALFCLLPFVTSAMALALGLAIAIFK